MSGLQARREIIDPHIYLPYLTFSIHIWAQRQGIFSKIQNKTQSILNKTHAVKRCMGLDMFVMKNSLKTLFALRLTSLPDYRECSNILILRLQADHVLTKTQINSFRGIGNSCRAVMSSSMTLPLNTSIHVIVLLLVIPTVVVTIPLKAKTTICSKSEKQAAHRDCQTTDLAD